MKEHIHFIGIGGIGMSGLAKMVIQRGGSTISGSDKALEQSYTLSNLEEKGSKLFSDHHEDNVEASTTRVIYSTDISLSNPEIIAAKKRNIPIQHRSELLGELMLGMKPLLVSGTHGKTTVSSLLSHVLTYAAKVDPKFSTPSYAVGGLIKNYGTNSHFSSSAEYFVAEADESDGTCLQYDPYAAILTNIDTDHLSHFGTIENIEKTLSDFCRKVVNPHKWLFVSRDCPRIRAEIKRGAIVSPVTYGMREDNDFVVENIRVQEAGTFFDIRTESGSIYKSIFIPLYGQHNAVNATAVFALALQIGIDPKIIYDAYRSFQGVKRRLDRLYTGKNEIIIFDDYAHHPTEIRATLQAIRAAFQPKRIVAIFQPHRPSRIKYIAEEFDGAFKDADLVFLMNLYLASEDGQHVDAINQMVTNIVEKSHLGKEIIALDSNELEKNILKHIRPGDVLLFMGAGDVSAQARHFAASLDTQQIQKYKVALFYGGMNSENKISRISAESIWNNINRDMFDVQAVLIETDGVWHLSHGVTHKKLLPCGEEKNETVPSKRIPLDVMKVVLDCDIAFPIIHGPYGEDGTIQGLFEIIGLPYVGSDHVSSGIAMDKELSKLIVANVGCPVVPSITIMKWQWLSDRAHCIDMLSRMEFSFPVFIKPVHLGSSVGIRKLESYDLLEKTFDELFELDTKLLVEQGLTDFREIEFAPRGNNFPQIPVPGEIFSHGKVYDYQAKYGSDAFLQTAAADLPEEILNEGRQYAKKAFQALGLSGLTRIDFFLNHDGTWYFNEANPIPGFTPISLYPSIWKKSGLSYTDLITSLIFFGFEKFREKQETAVRAAMEGSLLEKLCAVQTKACATEVIEK